MKTKFFLIVCLIAIASLALQAFSPMPIQGGEKDKCRQGEKWNGKGCEKDKGDDHKCKDGEDWNGKGCEKPPKCQPGYTLDGWKCVPVPPVVIVPPAVTKPQQGMCAWIAYKWKNSVNHDEQKKWMSHHPNYVFCPAFDDPSEKSHPHRSASAVGGD